MRGDRYGGDLLRMDILAATAILEVRWLDLTVGHIFFLICPESRRYRGATQTTDQGKDVSNCTVECLIKAVSKGFCLVVKKFWVGERFLVATI